MRRLPRGLAVALILVALGVGTCRRFLPRRYAINAPITHLLFGRGIPAPSMDVLLARLHVPPGFSLGRYAEGLPNARMLRFTPAGDLLVSQPREGRVTLLRRDADGDGRSDGREAVLSGLNRPHGLDLHEGWLYVAETDAVGRARFDAATGRVTGVFERLITGLPSGGNHWTKTVGFGPDGLLYVSMGSSCNACVEKDQRRAAILRYRPDGSGQETFATGLRNPVGFAWRPGTGELFATDNGRDLLGDDLPPCELDRVVPDGFYGWPFAYGDRQPDPDLGASAPDRVAASLPPAHAFRAHNAPLGITFLRGSSLPAEFRGAALVALHGSWNRTHKDGYKVVSLHWGDDGTISERDFLSGLSIDDDVVGRPVDVAEGPDGAVYVTDDYAGSIYRVAFGAPPSRSGGAGASDREAAGGDAAATPPADAEAIERGRALYARFQCGSCHEAQMARPGMVVRPLRGLRARYTSEALQAYLAAPNPPMPLFPLSRQERRELAEHLLAAYP